VQTAAVRMVTSAEISLTTNLMANMFARRPLP
jgi:hypothetical protein